MDLEKKIKIEELSDDFKVEEQQKISQKKKSACHKWENLEKVRYMIFLGKHIKYLKSQKLRDKMEWYKKMSICVGSNNDTCGYYHRLYMSKFHNIQGVLNHLKQTLFFDEELLQCELNRIQAIFRVFNQQNINKVENNSNSENAQEKRSCGEKCVGQVEFVKKQVQFNVKIDQKIDDFQIEKQVTFSLLLVIQTQKLQNQNNESSKVDQIIGKFKDSKSIIQPEIQTQKRIQIRKKTKTKRNRSRYHYLIRKKQITFQSFSKIGNQSNKKSGKQEGTMKQDYFIKRKRKIIWTKPESIKMIVFLYMNKKIFESNYVNRETCIYQKCRRYINTSKNAYNCKEKVHSLRQKYNKEISKIIEEEAKRLGISLRIFQKERNQYNLIFRNRLQCKIRVQNFSITHPLNPKQFNLNSQGNLNLKGQIHVSFEFQELSNQNERNQEQPNSMVSKSQKRSQQIHQNQDIENLEQKMVKTIIRVKAQQKVVELIKRHLRPSVGREILKMQNYIIIKINSKG